MIEDHNNPIVRLFWTILASFAGALTALSYRPFQNMTKGEITIALTVGASFAIFVGPLAASMIFRGDPPDMRIMGGLLYLMASGSNILIPLAVKRLSGVFGGRPAVEEEKK